MNELLSDMKFWAVIISGLNLAIIVAGLIVGKLVFDKLMNNDLKHLAIDLKAIKNKQEDHDKKFDDQKDSINNIAVKVAFLEGAYNTPRITRRKKSTVKTKKSTSKANKNIKK